MNNCKKYKKIIEELINGTISEEQLAELKNHTQMCESCREEFKHCVLLQDVLKHSLSSQTTAGQASASVMSKLSAKPDRRLQPALYGKTLSMRRQAAVAAAIILAVGLFLGFALGRAGTGRPITVPLSARVPINIGRLEGTVLVRHSDSDIWQTLQSGSNVYLGDTFHSAAKSACVLKLEDKSTLELSQNSMLVLKMYNGQTQFFLEHGECTASLESPHGPFFISTPNGRVEALGTEFTVKVTDE
jgi:ferric-dicitrate binding protein FerR (iron transport regulator)